MGELRDPRDCPPQCADRAHLAPPSDEAHFTRLRLDSEEVRVEGAMARRAHHETISWVIASTVSDGNDMRRVKDAHHLDLAWWLPRQRQTTSARSPAQRQTAVVWLTSSPQRAMEPIFTSS